MTELTAKKYLESKGLNDHDYMDSGMINHISEMMEEYHQAKLHLLTIPVVSKRSELLTFLEEVASDDRMMSSAGIRKRAAELLKSL